ncbi:MAG: DUF2878 domain-containing protein [Pseudomonadota bacterium]
MHILFNIVAFKLTWTACVYGAVNAMPWAGPLAAAVIIAIHLALARLPLPELQLVGLSGLMGLVFETALIQTGLVSFAGQLELAGLGWPPAWLLAMWLGFATLLNVSFRFLHHRLVVAALLGAAVGPLTYLGGESLGGITFTSDRTLALVAVAVMWGIAMPVLADLGRRFDGYKRTVVAQ